MKNTLLIWSISQLTEAMQASHGISPLRTRHKDNESVRARILTTFISWTSLRPSSIATDSADNGFRPIWADLLIAANIWPSLSLRTTQIPILQLISSNAAPTFMMASSSAWNTKDAADEGMILRDDDVTNNKWKQYCSTRNFT